MLIGDDDEHGMGWDGIGIRNKSGDEDKEGMAGQIDI